MTSSDGAPPLVLSDAAIGADGAVTSDASATDGTPDPFDFADVVDATPDTPVATSTVVRGFEGELKAAITGSRPRRA